MARISNKIDSKGRFFIPAKSREAFGGPIVVTKSLDRGFLCVYTREHYKTIEKQLKDLNGLDPRIRQLQRYILGEAQFCEVDNQGRLSVLPNLWRAIDAAPGDEISVMDFNDGEKMEICTAKRYVEENEAKINEEVQSIDYHSGNTITGL